MKDLRRQFSDMLVELGYYTKGNWDAVNSNSKNERIVRSVLLSGLEVAGINIPQQTYEATAEGAIAVPSKSKDFKFFANAGFRIFIQSVSSFIHHHLSFQKIDLKKGLF
jgi:hypothetical protein